MELQCSASEGNGVGETDSITVALKALEARDQSAATEIYVRFFNRLVALASSRLDNRLRERADPEDIAQSVFASFFARQERGEFVIDSWDSLWGLLCVITLGKCSNRVRKLRAQRRDADRDVILDDVHAAFDPEPTPGEAAALRDTISALLSAFNERDQAVLRLLLEGYSAPEISERLGVSERTIGRIVPRAKQRLTLLMNA